MFRNQDRRGPAAITLTVSAPSPAGAQALAALRLDAIALGRGGAGAIDSLALGRIAGRGGLAATHRRPIHGRSLPVAPPAGPRSVISQAR